VQGSGPCRFSATPNRHERVDDPTEITHAGPDGFHHTASTLQASGQGNWDAAISLGDIKEVHANGLATKPDFIGFGHRRGAIDETDLRSSHFSISTVSDIRRRLSMSMWRR